MMGGLGVGRQGACSGVLGYSPLQSRALSISQM